MLTCSIQVNITQSLPQAKRPAGWLFALYDVAQVVKLRSKNAEKYQCLTAMHPGIPSGEEGLKVNEARFL
jgi:hypothetical protein